MMKSKCNISFVYIHKNLILAKKKNEDFYFYWKAENSKDGKLIVRTLKRKLKSRSEEFYRALNTIFRIAKACEDASLLLNFILEQHDILQNNGKYNK